VNVGEEAKVLREAGAGRPWYTRLRDFFMRTKKPVNLEIEMDHLEDGRVKAIPPDQGPERLDTVPPRKKVNGWVVGGVTGAALAGAGIGSYAITQKLKWGPGFKPESYGQTLE